MNDAKYFVYVLQNSEGRLYIGFTTDLESRIERHQNDQGGWTKGKGPWQLVYHEAYIDRKEALRRERSLKHGQANQELRKKLSTKTHDPLA